MHDFLAGREGGGVPEGNIVIFPNGVHELMLEAALNNVLDEAAEHAEDGGTEEAGVTLYFCTETPVADHEDTLWLGGNEIRKEVVAYYAELAKKLGIGFQAVYDSDRELASEDDLGYAAV